MKIHRIILFISISVAMTGNAEAQLFKKIKKAVKRAVEEGISRTVEEKVYKKSSEKTGEVLDTIMGNKNKNAQKAPSVYGKKPQSAPVNQKYPNAVSGGLEEVDSGSSFKRGNIVLYEDNFSRDAVGDFPAKWNSAQGGEIKKLKAYEEKWLRVPATSVVNLEMTKPLPSNFTVEFDMIVPANIPIRMAAFAFGNEPKSFGQVLTPENQYAFYLNSDAVYKDGDALKFGSRTDKSYSWASKKYSIPLNKKIHVGIMVNNHQRIRLYLDGIKMVDAPRSFRPELAKAFFFHAMTHGGEDSKKNYFYVSNVVIAESGIDKRSLVMKELIEKGTFTTSDILFDSGSDKIQASSANILNQIGEAMKSAPKAQFLIIGHTDSDGSDSANQVLSQKRAESVKNYLVEKFNINGSKLMCVGKGESEPVSSNNTTTGKAQNRRVEFKKL